MTHAHTHDWSGPCLNCGTLPAGPWCQNCGQRAGPAHRSIRHLTTELLEILTHADSRFWRTLRRLAFDPGTLTRDYLAGRRASEIPPLRLFFVIMLLAFGIGALTGHHTFIADIPQPDRTRLHAELATTRFGHGAAGLWLHTHLDRAIDHPDEVTATMRDWSERFVIAMLPIAGLMLWALYVRQRHGLYDHLIVAIHSLSFVGLALIAMLLLGLVLPHASGLILLVLPIHLFAHLRGVYRSGIVATLLRMLLLFAGTLLASLALLAGLAGIGLQFGTGSAR
jgi:hypothetical protein